MFGWEFPPYNSGGLGTACEGLSRALVSTGVELIFVLPRTANLSSEAMRFRFAGIENLKVRTITSYLYPYITATSKEASGIYGRNLLDEVKLYAERAADIAREEVFDVIHAHDWLAFPAGLAAQAVSGRPLVVHVHATEFDRGGGNGVNQQVYNIEREGMQQAQKVITVSDWTKQMVIKHYGVAPEKIEVVHNGIEVNGFSPLPAALQKLRAAGHKIVLFVGRITLQKGPDYFVRAAQKVLAYEPKTLFVMVGSGDMEGQVIRLVSELGLGDKFIFPGFLRGEELNQIYQSADLYVLPSVSEPFGITPLESVANGTPVLISKQSGVSEVLAHALKVDFWDVDEMANQIIAVLHHPALHHLLSEYGKQEVGKITWGLAARKCLDIYNNLLGAPRLIHA